MKALRRSCWATPCRRRLPDIRFHSIAASLEVLGILGIATQAEVQSGNVTGLERAIAKNKAVEFGSLLHQLAADYFASPHSAGVKKMLTAINPHAVVPKRSARAK